MATTVLVLGDLHLLLQLAGSWRTKMMQKFMTLRGNAPAVSHRAILWREDDWFFVVVAFSFPSCWAALPLSSASGWL